MKRGKLIKYLEQNGCVLRREGMNTTMNMKFNITSITFRLLALFYFIFIFNDSTKSQDAFIKINLRGVYESKITLLPLSGTNALKPILIVDGIKTKESATLKVPAGELPGEFVLRFDYKENITSTPYPSEKRIIVNDQKLELWVHPIYCNNTDSTWFQKDERENRTFLDFSKENARQKQMIGLLQNFLLNYDDPNSTFYTDGITEYEKRRIASNKWINEQIKQNKSLFVSSMFGFQKMPEIDWKGSETNRKQSLRDNYFEGMDLSEPLMIRTTSMKEWMDGYVNLYGELATTTSLRDSQFTIAGKNAIEKAKKGDPVVYGWMVDYFFKGYESFNIQTGIKMLEPYLNDPDCLTTKRQEINKRLKGMKTIVSGTFAPDIIMPDSENKPFVLSSFTNKKNMLLLFWSADCSHCRELTGKLYQFYQQPEIQQKLDIVAVSIDETDTEILAWRKNIEEMKGWIHLRAEDGVRSKVAQDYYILSVPVMILIDSETKKIIGLPENTRQLDKLLGF